MTQNLLFVCSQNQWRSPTAERVFKNHPQVFTRSAGTSSNARKTISAQDIQWADLIFVMEEKHKSRIVADFKRLAIHKKIIVLDIPDDYQYMDAELIEQLELSVSPYLLNDS